MRPGCRHQCPLVVADPGNRTARHRRTHRLVRLEPAVVMEVARSSSMPVSHRRLSDGGVARYCFSSAVGATRSRAETAAFTRRQSLRTASRDAHRLNLDKSNDVMLTSLYNAAEAQ